VGTGSEIAFVKDLHRLTAAPIPASGSVGEVACFPRTSKTADRPIWPFSSFLVLPAVFHRTPCLRL
jgi:hypothetical protein